MSFSHRAIAVDHRLRHVGDHRQPAGHVAVERAVPDRQFRLVAGGQQQRAALVRERHQQVAADARLNVLLRDVASRTRRTPGRAWRPSRASPVRSAASASRMPRLAASSQRIVDAAAAGVGRWHQHAEHVIGAERLGGDRGRQRRVDAAGQPEDGVGESALADVVARAEDERAPDLRFGAASLPARSRRSARASMSSMLSIRCRRSTTSGANARPRRNGRPIGVERPGCGRRRRGRRSRRTG